METQEIAKSCLVECDRSGKEYTVLCHIEAQTQAMSHWPAESDTLCQKSLTGMALRTPWINCREPRLTGYTGTYAHGT